MHWGSRKSGRSPANGKQRVRWHGRSGGTFQDVVQVQEGVLIVKLVIDVRTALCRCPWQRLSLPGTPGSVARFIILLLDDFVLADSRSTNAAACETMSPWSLTQWAVGMHTPFLLDAVQGLVHQLVEVLHLFAVHAGRALDDQRGCVESANAQSDWRANPATNYVGRCARSRKHTFRKIQRRAVFKGKLNGLQHVLR